MNDIDKLVEEHALASAAHLRHIDELMGRAHLARAKAPDDAELDSLVKQTQQGRDSLAQHLDHLAQRPAATELPKLVERGHGLTGGLAAVGLQLEKALASILNSSS